MKAFDDDRGIRWLFWMVHPDDEVFIGAWIRRLTDARCHVDLGWTHHTPVRQEEAIASARLLGVPPERLHFLDGEDGLIVEQMPTLFPVFNDKLRTIEPHRVVTTAFEQGHLDHDATNLMVNRAFGGPVFEVPMYHPYVTWRMTLGEFADPSAEERIDLTAAEVSLKKALLAAYRSQSLRVVYRAVDLLHRISGRRRLFRWERLRLQTHTDFSTPNLPELLRSRVAGSAPWRRWQSAAAAFDGAFAAGTF